MPLRDRSRLTDYSCFFITTTCNNWLNLLQSEKYFSLLYDSLNFVNKKYNAQIVAYVFMPNHIHLIIYFHKENHLSAYMRDFKKFTSVQIRTLIESDRQDILLDQLRYSKREQKFKVWMDRFDDVFIKSTKVLLTKIQYIHANPVKKGLSKYQEDYKHSSAGFYFKESNPLIPILHYSELI
jgi:putative transposase